MLKSNDWYVVLQNKRSGKVHMMTMRECTYEEAVDSLREANTAGRYTVLTMGEIPETGSDGPEPMSEKDKAEALRKICDLGYLFVWFEDPDHADKYLDMKKALRLWIPEDELEAAYNEGMILAMTDRDDEENKDR